ncbi:sensor histidine kinase [Salinimonas lutimaris]|uniref:sensor histidine kinase n=1 Tax=Salinimonas lutimaris TaxID=914153 RepID=UPI0010C14573|nr:ATP-binding protein [Salinimonas lutimaris]
MQQRTVLLVALDPVTVSHIHNILADVAGWNYQVVSRLTPAQQPDCIITPSVLCFDNSFTPQFDNTLGPASALSGAPVVFITEDGPLDKKQPVGHGTSIAKYALDAESLHEVITESIISRTLQISKQGTDQQVFRVLLVDANEQDVATVKKLLGAVTTGFEITQANTPAQAMPLLAHTQFDCILVDYTLPQENGLVLLEALTLSQSEIPAIMLTRDGSEAIAVEAMRKGADNYFIKFDFAPRQLEQAIRESIFHKRLARQIRLKDEELIRTNREVASTNRFLDEVIDTMPGLFFVKDSDYKVVKANKHFLSLYPESKRDKVIGYTTVEDYPQEEAERFLADDKRAFELGFVDTHEAIHFPDGRRRLLYTQKKRFTDVNGEDFILAICSDETEREELIDELQKSNADLAQFAYVASHDLKSPLQAINKLISWIEEDHGHALPAEAMEHFGLIKSRSRRMMSLLDDLLTYSKVHNSLADEETLSLADFAADILAMNDRHQHFVLEVPSLTVSLPRVALQIVLMNLFSNTIKHHHQASGSIALNITYYRQGYRLTYTDDGPGVAAEYRQKVFKMFHTLRPRDEVEGSGMGLALVKKVVEYYQGEIALCEPEHQGIQVEIYWPVKNPVLHKDLCCDEL